jgi:hypothetical protein
MHQKQDVTSSTKASFIQPRAARSRRNIAGFDIVKRQHFKRRDVIARQHGLGLLPGQKLKHAVAQKENADIFGQR